MKLLLCLRCQDIVKLKKYTDGVIFCMCGNAFGAYLSDGWHAVVGRMDTLPIGLNNRDIGEVVGLVLEAKKANRPIGWALNIEAFTQHEGAISAVRIKFVDTLDELKEVIEADAKKILTFVDERKLK